jgi:hypothetical protein
MPLPKPREGESLGFHVYPSVSDEGTLGDPETIIWSSIRHLCSRGVAEAWAARLHGITRKREQATVARSLKLYIQQAHEFYEAARAAKANTAPLIYYYSFLNLAKALCELRQPRFHERPECYRHGLSWKPNPRQIADPATEKVSITTRGVWHVLWESLTLSRCPAANPTTLAIKDLFSYCPEVAVEFQRAFGSSIRLVDLESPDVLYDRATSDAWLRFSVGRFGLKHFRLSAPALTSQIRTARSGYVEVKSANREIRTFQSAIAKRLGRRESALEGIRVDILGLNVFTHLGRERKLEYHLPVEDRLPFRMPQLMVSYTILFWLGSLVRYDPHSVNALMDSQYWMLVDGFMSQSRLWLLELFEWAFYRAETTLWTTR